MEPLMILLAALATGASAAASQAVKDAYEELKGALRKKWEEKKLDPQAAEVTLANYGQKPEVWEGPMKDMLIESAATQDPTLLGRARDLLRLVEEAEPGKGVSIRIEKILNSGSGDVNVAGGSILRETRDRSKDE